MFCAAHICHLTILQPIWKLPTLICLGVRTKRIRPEGPSYTYYYSPVAHSRSRTRRKVNTGMRTITSTINYIKKSLALPLTQTNLINARITSEKCTTLNVRNIFWWIKNANYVIPPYLYYFISDYSGKILEISCLDESYQLISLWYLKILLFWEMLSTIFYYEEFIFLTCW